MRTMLPRDISTAMPMCDGAGEAARRLAAWVLQLLGCGLFENSLGSGKLTY